MTASCGLVLSLIFLKARLEPIVRGHVKEGTRLTADEWVSYNDLKSGFDLGRVNHSAKEWVVGVHHTNTIEGHWGHFKRAVRGTHVHISAKHMWKYVAEFTYRRNFRQSHEAMFDRLVAAFALPACRTHETRSGQTSVISGLEKYANQDIGATDVAVGFPMRINLNCHLTDIIARPHLRYPNTLEKTS